MLMVGILITILMPLSSEGVIDMFPVTHLCALCCPPPCPRLTIVCKIHESIFLKPIVRY